MPLCQRYLFQRISFHRSGCKAASPTNCISRTTESKLLQGRNRKRKVICGFQNHPLLLVDPQGLGYYMEGKILIKWWENNLCLLDASYSNDFNFTYSQCTFVNLVKQTCLAKAAVRSLNNNLKLCDLTVGTTPGMS